MAPQTRQLFGPARPLPTTWFSPTLEPSPEYFPTPAFWLAALILHRPSPSTYFRLPHGLFFPFPFWYGRNKTYDPADPFFLPLFSLCIFCSSVGLSGKFAQSSLFFSPSFLFYKLCFICTSPSRPHTRPPLVPFSVMVLFLPASSPEPLLAGLVDAFNLLSRSIAPVTILFPSFSFFLSSIFCQICRSLFVALLSFCAAQTPNDPSSRHPCLECAFRPNSFSKFFLPYKFNGRGRGYLDIPSPKHMIAFLLRYSLSFCSVSPNCRGGFN